MLESLNSNSLIIAVVALLLLYFIYKKRSGKSDDTGFKYVAKTDEGAQKLYEDKLKDKNPLTKEEKVELSWQFLYDITDIVLNKFSDADKKAAHELGHKIISQGGGYEHVVDYGIKKEKKTSRLVDEQDKSQDSQLKR